MSDFTCKKGHIMNGFRYCPECGGEVEYMDGETSDYWERLDMESVETEIEVYNDLFRPREGNNDK